MLCVASPAFSQRTRRINEDCENEIHGGLNSSGGNRTSLGGSAGLKGCFDDQVRRWAADGDFTVVRVTLADGSKVTAQRHEVEGGYERIFHQRWSWLLEVSHEADTGSGLESRFIAAPGIGVLFKQQRTATSFEVGLARTWENNRGEPRNVFPEAWVEGDFRWQIKPTIKFREKLELFASTEDESDYRYDAETSLAVQLGEHISLKLAYDLRWDSRPAPRYGKTDWTTRTLFVYSWNRGTR